MTHAPRRGPAASLALAAILTSGCAALSSQRSVLEDDTATWAARAGCDGAQPRRGCAEALTQEERIAVEEALATVVRRVPRTSVERIRLRVLPPGAAVTRVQGSALGTIEMPARDVRWALGPPERRALHGESFDRAVALLSFAIAHEVGHMLSPRCAGECARAAECELEADAVATTLGASPLLLGRIADDEHRRHVADLAEQLAAAERSLAAGTDTASIQESLWRPTEECVRIAEAQLRYAHAQAVHALLRRGPSWDDRLATRDDLTDARNHAAAALERLTVCASLAGMLPRGQQRACVEARLESVRTAVAERAAAEVPREHDPRLWPDGVRWTADADALFHTGLGPAWGSFPGRAPRWGSRARGLVAYEGGLLEYGGVQVSVARFGQGISRLEPFRGEWDVSTLAAELVAGRALPLASTFALSGELGVGITRISYADAPASTRPSASLEARVAWAAARRIHVSAGVVYATAVASRLADLAHVVAFTLGAELHAGNYGARHGR